MEMGKIRKGRCRNGRGFTLMEVIAVLVIIGIVAVVVISRSFSTSEIDLASQAEVVKSHIRYAQARAMNTNTVWYVQMLGAYFDVTSYEVFAWEVINNVLTQQPKLVPGQDSVWIPLPPDMTITGADYISFDSWGAPYNNDTGTGASETIIITLKYKDQTNSFSITKNTGFIQ